MSLSLIRLFIDLVSLNYLNMAAILVGLIVTSILKLSKPARQQVYMLDYACYKPRRSQQRTRDQFMAEVMQQGVPKFKDEAIQFVRKGIMTAGIGDSTHIPVQLLMNPPDLSIDGARNEAEAAMFGAVDALLAKTGIKTDDIGVLVVNCSLFNPVPSLSSMIVNRYKLKLSVKSFNLSGMGCSASPAAIGLAQHLLQVHENSCAMVVSIEAIGQHLYRGDHPNKLANNCVFRVGGAAILLTNRPSDRRSSKYQLIHTVRTNTGSSNNSHRCVYQEEDEHGLLGITISKDLLVEASKAITAHVTTLCYMILPIVVKLQLLICYLLRKPYAPNFKSVIDHWFPHVGGKMVIDVMERAIKMDVEAARMTLYRFGNTSSSSVWYELAYAEAKGRIKNGDRVWQIAFGAGFECTSVIWRAIKDGYPDDTNPWWEEIDDYPINLDLKASPLVFEEPR